MAVKKEKALFGVWSELKASEINRILKAHGVRLVVKGSKLWGDKVNVTAQKIEAAVAPVLPAPATGGGEDGRN
jgi:TolB-like protein